jgi:hypothetical protein
MCRKMVQMWYPREARKESWIFAPLHRVSQVYFVHQHSISHSWPASYELVISVASKYA